MPTSNRSILKSLVEHVKNEEHDPLTPLIDEYLVKRVKPKYAKRRLTTYEVPIGERPRPLGRFSPSTMCGCERQAAFKFLGVRGKTRINPDTELIFEDGNWRHHKWAALMLDMEKVLKGKFRVLAIEEPIRIPKFFIAGTLDIRIEIKINGVWIEIVIDFKGANTYAFDVVHRQQAPRAEHVLQVHPYMRAKKVERGMILYDSKDRNEVHIFSVPFSQEKWNIIREWIGLVIEQIEDRELPPMHPECDRGNFLGDKCPFRGICYGNKDDDDIAEEIYKDYSNVRTLWKKGIQLEEGH